MSLFSYLTDFCRRDPEAARQAAEDRAWRREESIFQRLIKTREDFQRTPLGAWSTSGTANVVLGTSLATAAIQPADRIRAIVQEVACIAMEKRFCGIVSNLAETLVVGVCRQKQSEQEVLRAAELLEVIYKRDRTYATPDDIAMLAAAANNPKVAQSAQDSINRLLLIIRSNSTQPVPADGHYPK